MRLFTSRKLITAIGIAISTVALFKGKMSDGVWVYAMAVFIAGHHAVDIISAWKGQTGDSLDPAATERDWKGEGNAGST